MIQPNELMRGNWITIANGDKWWPVTEIKENFIKVVQLYLPANNEPVIVLEYVNEKEV